MTEQLTYQDLTNSAGKAAVAELAYLDGEGKVRLRPITPLVFDEDLTFTLTYADSKAAEELRRSPESCVILSDSRLARVGWKPLAATLRLGMTTDLEGDFYREELLEQELVKYPPGRHLIDSMMLRRENWWYLPRFVFRAVEIRNVRAVERRADPDHAVLAFQGEDGLAADTVRVEDWTAKRIPIRSLADRELSSSSSVALHKHDFSVPDMERRNSFLATGALNNGRLNVERREGEGSLGKLPGLFARWRDHRSLERACKAEIKEQEARIRRA